MTESSPVEGPGASALGQAGAARSELERLEIFVGTWRTEGEIVTDPSAAPLPLRATDSYEWLPGRHFLLHRVDGRLGDEEVQTLEIIGYDATVGAYFTHSYDNHGNVGLYQASLHDRAWSITGSSERFTGAFSHDGTTLAGIWERFADGEGWTHWMTIRLTRAG